MAFYFIGKNYFNVSMGFYFVSFLGYLLFALSRRHFIGLLSTCLLGTGFVVHSTGLVIRWLETHQAGFGYVPLSNMYESLIFFSWATVLIYLILEWKYRQKIIGVLMSPLACMAIAVTSIIPGIDPRITPLIPALQSNWLTIHVTACFLGYAAFAVSFGVSLLYCIHDKINIRLPSTVLLDEINYKSILIGFPMLTLGIMTGAAWAHYAWGRYWGWDPKETWSLITWFIYAAFLHARYTMDWRGKKAALLSIAGFIAVLFTFFGVTYLLPGLHSYLS